MKTTENLLSPHSTPTAQPIFRTNNLHFSVWLICENLLEFTGCLLSPGLLDRGVLFCFRDPQGRGGELQAQWLASNPLLPQKTVIEIVQALRREMVAVKQQAGTI